MKRKIKMPIFVINLRKNTERMESIRRQLEGMGLDYERFDAVYGRDLSCKERQEKFSKWRSRFAIGCNMTDGELGCALSHIAIYNLMVENNIEFAIVLEDDVVVSEHFGRAILAAGEYCSPYKPQVILFSSYEDNVNEANNNGIRKVPSAMCTDGYLITLEAAKLISRINYPVVVQADAWTRWHKRYGLELYRSRPATIRQDNSKFGTDIDTWTMPSQMGASGRRSVVDYLIFKARRVFEKAVDWVIWKFNV